MKFWIHLISLCFIVGRSHKKYTIIKKENKKAIYGKPGVAFLSHISTVPPSSLSSFYLFLFSQLHSIFFFFVNQKGSREEKKREKRPTVFSC